jgi:hypothetical protein
MRRYLGCAGRVAVLVLVAVNVMAAAIGCAGLAYVALQEDPQVAAQHRQPAVIHPVPLIGPD